MSSQNALHHRFDDIIEDHRRLQQLLRRIRETVVPPNPDIYRVARLLADLQDELAAHFAHEEHGGYLHEALARAPHWVSRASVLAEEHGSFLRNLREIRDEVGAGNIRDIAERFRRFETSFNAHETNEISLIQEAMLRDFDAED